MSRSATFAIGTASVVAVAVGMALFASHSKAPEPPRKAVSDGNAEPVAAEPNTAEIEPAPSLVPTLTARPVLRVPAAGSAEKRVEEPALLEKLHDLAASDPPLSLKLARQAVDRFPDSPNAPEFEWNVVKSLYNMNRLEEAKDEARIMLWKYPNNYFTNDVEHHLLNHPPNPPGTPP
jgi:hypothetical protein